MIKIRLPYWFAWVLMAITLCACSKEEGSLGNGNSLTHITHNPTALTVELPEFFDPLSVPSSNPLTEEGVDLGRHLFYDPVLSQNGETACSSCHQIEHNFSNNVPVAVGADGLENTRSTLSLTNIGFVRTGFFLDGAAMSIEEATLQEIENSNRIGGQDYLSKLQENQLYQEKFRKAFPIESTDEITTDLVVKALSQFQRTLISGWSKLDQAQSSSPTGVALTTLELDGYFLFFREQNFTLHPGCSHCHEATYFDGQDYYNNGIDAVQTLNDFQDLGRGAVTGEYMDQGRFRAPTLRNIEYSAPYMHDGRFTTLDEVLDHYESGGHGAENLDPEITGFPLTEYERASLIAFMKALSDQQFLNNPSFQSPF